jgi:predicted ATP-dependent endonuclease of OLD family
MIRSVKFKFGRAPGIAPETVQTTPITVFVGPNNSGKSKVLQELHRYCTTGDRDLSDVIVERIEFENLSSDRSEERVRHVTLSPNPGESLRPDHVIVGKKGNRHQVKRDSLIRALQDTNAQARNFCQWYLVYNTLILDGKNRIALVNEQSAGDLQQPPHTVMFHAKWHIE